jgi:RNA polymerase sigma-70 factor (ECF subfamily)
MAMTQRTIGVSERARRGGIVHLPVAESDAMLVGAIRAGQSSGGASMYDRHHEYVRRVLVRVLGSASDLDDLIQDVFVTAIDAIDRLEDPHALRAWLAGIAVRCARVEIRRRTRARWFPLFDRADLPEVEAPVSDPELDETVRLTYGVLQKLSADERIAFALRFIEGMELVEVAEVCDVSLATTKRRLQRARKKFMTMAQTYPELSDWLSEAQA